MLLGNLISDPYSRVFIPVPSSPYPMTPFSHPPPPLKVLIMNKTGMRWEMEKHTVTLTLHQLKRTNAIYNCILFHGCLFAWFWMVFAKTEL